MASVEKTLKVRVALRGQELRNTETRNAIIGGIAILALLLLVLLLTVAIARSMVTPLRRLRTEALEVAGFRLPDVVRKLRVSGDAAPDIHPIDVEGNDEIGEVAKAFDQVHRQAVRLAGEEADLRSNISSMFVNLSRRTQTLVERQLAKASPPLDTPLGSVPTASAPCWPSWRARPTPTAWRPVSRPEPFGRGPRCRALTGLLAAVVVDASDADAPQLALHGPVPGVVVDDPGSAVFALVARGPLGGVVVDGRRALRRRPSPPVRPGSPLTGRRCSHAGVRPLSRGTTYARRYAPTRASALWRAASTLRPAGLHRDHPCGGW
ncbi:HAMP domain-containing protein [Nonomuraea sediminis]|uniref:HAMP domain-containing protein n=1 Tax=Nonomuraea sediminis TaxID=2835864 RepID=UPI001BDBC805|nr:HAMP domain-containing protein [Nonomuraea sediminis]